MRRVTGLAIGALVTSLLGACGADGSNDAAKSKPLGGKGPVVDRAQVQLLVRAKCDAKAVITGVKAYTDYYEAQWGVAKVALPGGKTKLAPAFWARLNKVLMTPDSTVCGVYEY